MTRSIRSRFGISLFANLSKAALTFGTSLLVARGLGPDQYGRMMFLLGTFAAIRQLLDMGSSSAFFTFLSQRQRTRRYIGWYFSWLGVQFLLPFLVIGLLFPFDWIDLVWKGERRELVVLAFTAAYMQSILWQAVLQMGESQRLTHRVQGVAVFTAFAHLSVIFFALSSDWLEVRVVFIFMIIEWGAAAVLIIKWLHFPSVPDELDRPTVIFKEFWHYCLPLVPYAWLGFAYEFADRWIMQMYSGSVQQAYYSVANQFGAIAAIATSSILNIFWKEIAEAHHQNNQERVALLYKKVTRGLFFVAAAGAGFLAPWSEEILSITLGASYVGGAMTLTVMFFYPLHQSMGQIGGTMAYATGRVAPYVKMGMVFMSSSIFVTYIVLATPDAPLPGLAMGSLGLAGKMVVMQLIQVNALAFYLSRSLGIKFDWSFQPVVALACAGAGLLAHSASQFLLDVSRYLWFALLVSGGVYAFLVLALLCVTPSLAGLRRADLFSAAATVLRVIRR